MFKCKFRHKRHTSLVVALLPSRKVLKKPVQNMVYLQNIVSSHAKAKILQGSTWYARLYTICG